MKDVSNVIQYFLISLFTRNKTASRSCMSLRLSLSLSLSHTHTHILLRDHANVFELAQSTEALKHSQFY
jgi:hypothetical protein